MPLDAALTQLTHHVVGVDLHPVAVALARVTYLLAIGHQRLTDQRGPITIPVYLGDSMQWRQRRDLFTEEHVRISAGYSTSEVEEWLRFPKRLLDEPSRFDQIVAGLASLAAKPRDPDNPPSLAAFFHHMRIGSEDQPMIRGTFEVMCRLHDEGRDHIWSYYLRNLARPVWLAMDDNRMHVLISNPPWLSYRHMPRDMQTRLRELSRDRGLWRGREFATNQDLSALFVTRAVQQYLRDDGSFAFVLPNSVLDREYFEGFGRGWYEDTVEPTAVAFTGSLDLRRLRPHPFPRGACVVFGDRATLSTYRRLPSVTERWTGRLPTDAKSWQQVEPLITREAADVVAGGSALTESPYKPRFAQGATIVPRVLFFVETDTGGRLGLGAGRHAVRSARSNLEKAPWKELPALEGVVESEFIRPVLLGESLLPYRILPAKQAVLPLDGSTLMTGPGSRLDYHFGLAEWWRKAEATWEAYRSSARLTLAERLDFHRGLSAQFPAPPLRLVYSASGAPIATLEEGLFLSAILNSSVLTELVRPMMSYGKDERDIDKHAWNLPIPSLMTRTRCTTASRSSAGSSLRLSPRCTSPKTRTSWPCAVTSAPGSRDTRPLPRSRRSSWRCSVDGRPSTIRLNGSGSAAAISKLGDDCSLERVHGTIYSGHPVGRVKDVTQIPWLGVQALPHLGGVDINNVLELSINHLMLIPDEPHQVPDQQRLIVGDLMVRRDDEPRDPQHQLGVPTPLAQTLGEFDHPRLVTEDSSRVPPCEQRRITVQHHRKWNADHGDTDLDDVALQEELSDEGEALRGIQYRP